jgi:Coenzyme PQQ synthesis protein D (PqqD)
MPPGNHPRGRPDVEAHLLPDASCLLFDPRTGQGLALTSLGGLVWDYCDGALSRDEIASEVASLVPQDPGMSESVQQFLDAFAEHGLLMSEDVVPS